MTVTVAFCVHGARTWLQRTAPLLRRHVLAPLRALALRCRPRGEPPEDGDALPWAGHAAPHEGAHALQALACLAPCLRLVQEHESRHGLRVRWLGMAAAHALFLAPHPPLGVLPPRWHNESRGALWVQHGIPLSGYYLLRLPGGPLTHADPVRLVRGLPSHTMPPLVAPACPPGAPGCRRVAGHDVYVGDGDRPGPSVAECERRLFIGDPRLATYWPIHAFMPQCCGPIVLPLPLGAVFLDA